MLALIPRVIIPKGKYWFGGAIRRIKWGSGVSQYSPGLTVLPNDDFVVVDFLDFMVL